jgi:radical SAM superfamily enzyme YgiQ (UPF0313 family)
MVLENYAKISTPSITSTNNVPELINFNKPQKSKYQSVALLNMPKIGLNNPPMAPAILQAIAVEMGCDVKFRDLNLDFQDQFEDQTEITRGWCELGQPLTPSDSDQLIAWMQDLDLTWIYTSEVVGISVFSKHSHSFTTWFLKNFKHQIKGIVVVGGAGAGTENYGQQLFDQGLVDYVVSNEGERSWRNILADQLPFVGVNSPGDVLPDFTDVPIPDYTGYDLDRYLTSKAHGRTIGVEGSRGCVRNCTFCDIGSFWKKYKFKDGRALAQELIHLQQQFQVEHFFFNDSLVNGSDRAFRDFCSVLAEYNKNAIDPIKWSGYYIIKPMQNYKERDWQNLKDSGVKSLFIGIESGSESVRNHMKKKFSNADIDHAMERIQFYGIRCTWLLIVGYPTETEEDFEQTLELLRRYQPMGLDRTIDTVALGMTLAILPGTPLYDLRESLNVVSMIPGHEDDCVTWKNENSDFSDRVRRRIRAEEEIRKLGYNSWIGDNDLIQFFEKKLEDIEKERISDDDFAEFHS